MTSKMTSKLITPESPLLIPPLLATTIGLESAVILQQIHYYSQNSKHLLEDGRRWFYLTFRGWAEKIPFLKVSAIRSAIANLRKLNLIDVVRHSQKTWYQANWYTINAENVKALWDSICQNQQIDLPESDTSICGMQANHNKEISSKEISAQEQYAVGEEEDFEPNWESLGSQIGEWEKAQNSEIPTSTHYVEEISQNSVSIETFRADNFPAAPDVPVEKNKSDSPTTEEISLACRELRSLRIEAEPCLKHMRENWGNVAGAIAFIREQVNAGFQPKKTWIAYFRWAVSAGMKPEKYQAPTGFGDWYDWAYKQGFVEQSRLKDGAIAICLRENMAARLGVQQWVRFEKAVELLGCPR